MRHNTVVSLVERGGGEERLIVSPRSTVALVDHGDEQLRRFVHGARGLSAVLRDGGRVQPFEREPAQVPAVPQQPSDLSLSPVHPERRLHALDHGLHGTVRMRVRAPTFTLYLPLSPPLSRVLGDIRKARSRSERTSQ